MQGHGFDPSLGISHATQHGLKKKKKDSWYLKGIILEDRTRVLWSGDLVPSKDLLYQENFFLSSLRIHQLCHLRIAIKRYITSREIWS